MPGLLAQGGAPGSLEFTATLFDLIRRGRYRADQVTTERKIWGGLKTQQISDLELSLGDVEAPVEAFEAPVAEVVDSIVVDGPERLSLFRDRIEDDRTGNSERFTSLQVGRRHGGEEPALVPEHRARRAARRRSRARSRRRPELFGGIGSYNSVAPTWNSVVAIALGVCGLVGAAVLVASAFNRRLWRRRSPEAQAEAERWEAFRRYLTDFPRLDIAPAASLELWERYLVYGIAFGIAERVLQGAQLHMPEALAHGEHALLDRPARRPRARARRR